MQSHEMHPRNPAATPSVFYPQAFYFSELGAEISRICDLHLFWPKRPRRFVAVRCWAVWGCTGSRRLWSEFQRVLWRIICLFARLDIWPFFWNRRLVYECQIHPKGLNKFWDSPADRLGLLTSVLLYEDKVVMTWSSSWAQNCCVSLAFDAISFMRMLPSKVWETYTRPTLTRSSPPGFGWVDSPDVKLHCFPVLVSYRFAPPLDHPFRFQYGRGVTKAAAMAEQRRQAVRLHEAQAPSDWIETIKTI